MACWPRCGRPMNGLLASMRPADGGSSPGGGVPDPDAAAKSSLDVLVGLEHRQDLMIHAERARVARLGLGQLGVDRRDVGVRLAGGGCLYRDERAADDLAARLQRARRDS